MRSSLIIATGLAFASASEGLHGLYGGDTKISTFGKSSTLYAWLNFRDATHADINVQFSSLLNAHCKAEVYALDTATGKITLPNQAKPGDCLYNYTEGKSAFIKIESVAF